VDRLAPHFVMLEEVFRQAHRFDVVHFHTDYLHYPLSRRARVPQVTTLHGRLDLPELGPLYAEYADMPVVSISDAQRRPLPGANWQATVHHGLPPDLYRCRDRPGDYLAFLGRISPEKRVDRAVEIARRAGLRLRVAAKVDAADQSYFRREIEPLFRDPLVEYVGEIGDQEKGAFLAGARAVLFPIDWPEPFGLVMIEAMACGTPVVAWPAGSVPEVIDDGVTGFVVDTIDAAVDAVRRVADLDRRRCRAVFEDRFGAARMAHDYVAVYRKLAATRDQVAPSRAPAPTRTAGRRSASPAPSR
jgi:glycosyltransferase involved in cell wall biosynthesis